MTDAVPAPAQTPTPTDAATLPPMDLSRVDYGALTNPVAPAQIRAFRTQVRAAQRSDPSIRTGLTTATTVFAVFFMVMICTVFLGVGFAIADQIAEDGYAGVGSIIPFCFMLGFIALGIFIVVKHFGAGGPWVIWYRLTQFAQANGLQFRTRSPAPSYPGMIFNLGDSRAATNHLNSTTGRYFDLGTYQYSTGSGKSRSTHLWGFLALKLDRELPNMVLDSKENNGIFGTDLPIALKRDQILSLEGDFDKHFTLYCPQEYEQDALYVFTPDLMALLIDDAGTYDVEIVDDWMFLYSPHPLPPLSEPTYAHLFSIIQTVGNKTVSQTANYHDDRVGSLSQNIVAPEGQRLRHGTSIGAIVVSSGIALFWLFSIFHGFDWFH
jgi:hypothetical protein